MRQALARLTQTVTAQRSCDRTQIVQILPVCTISAPWHNSVEQQRWIGTSTFPPYSRENVVAVPVARPAQLPTAPWHGLHTLPPTAASHDDPGQCCENHDHHHHHHPSSQAKPVTATAAAAGGEDGDEDLSEEKKVQQVEEAHLAESMERLIMEAYKLLQQGDMQQAESLLQEGSLALDQGMGTGGSASHPRQAEIYDQLSLFQFLQGKLPEAEVNARRSLAIIQNHFDMEDPAVAMCELRLGTILFNPNNSVSMCSTTMPVVSQQDAYLHIDQLKPKLGMGQYREAQTLITESYNGLKAALGDTAQVVGESQYYLAMIPLLTVDSEDAVAQTDPMLMQGLRNMRSNAGAGPLLVQAALREHNRLVDAHLTGQNWDKAAWLFRQEIRLRNGVDPASEDLSLLLYQFATLQYTRGQYDEAEALTQFSLDIAKSVYRHDENQTMLRRHRLGTVLDCKGNPEEANKLLTQSFNHFDKRLGPKNPLTGEAQFALALSGLRQMLQVRQSEGGMDIYSKVLGPKQQQDLLHQMQKGLQSMQAGFGADHMLVKKALSDYSETASALRSV